MDVSIFCKIMVCWVYSLESPRRDDYIDFTQYIFLWLLSEEFPWGGGGGARGGGLKNALWKHAYIQIYWEFYQQKKMNILDEKF